MATTVFILGYGEGSKLVSKMEGLEMILISCQGNKITTNFSDGLKRLKNFMKPITISEDIMEVICHD